MVHERTMKKENLLQGVRKMIEAIKILGESMMKTAGSEPFLSSLIDQVDADRYIVIFDFKTDDDIEIKIDTWGVDAEKLDKVKWVGNVKGNSF